MNIIKKTLLASAVSAAALLTASAASAADTYSITDVGLIPSFTQTVTLSGAINATEYAGLITLTTSTGTVIPTFCVDLFHTITIGAQSPALTYTTGPLAFDSNVPLNVQPGVNGNPLSADQIGKIYDLTDIGVQAYKSGTGTGNEYAALQGAIWGIEYGATVHSADAGIYAAIQNYIATATPISNGWTLIPTATFPNGNYPQALVTAPGPNVGEGLLGFAAMTALLIGARYRGLFV